MKKVATIDVYVDETLSDAKECVDDVITNAQCHEFISDGSVKLEVKQIDNKGE